MKLTTNLDGSAMSVVGADSFWVKLMEDSPDWTQITGALLASGLFKATGDFASSGLVSRYAQRWEFTTKA